MSGFANSGGGILIIGINENRWAITRCKAPGQSDLSEWAYSCLQKIVSLFSPPPRFHVVNHPDGDVLVGAVDRSLNYVQVIEHGDYVYYFRHGNQTLRAEEWLIGDLLTGRRQHPILNITDQSLRSLSGDDDGGYYTLSFVPSFVIENESLMWAEDTRLGLVSLTMDSKEERISRQLRTNVDVKHVDKNKYSYKCVLKHQITTPASHTTLEPFMIDNVYNFGSQKVPVSFHNKLLKPYNWKAAVYLLAKNSPPIWYQLEIPIDQIILTCLRNGTRTITDQVKIQIRRMRGKRPVVSWEGENF